MNMVAANNAIRLCEIRAAAITDQGIFRNINSEPDHHMAMKQLYTVPVQRNSNVVKEARYQYVEVKKHYYTVMPVISCSWSLLA